MSENFRHVIIVILSDDYDHRVFPQALASFHLDNQSITMKKILCLVDFSEASRNGLEYAAQLTKALEASLTLLYVRTSIWPEAVQLEKEVSKSVEDIGLRLSLFSTEVRNEFGVPCDFHIEQTTSSFEETVAATASHYDLIVMGTNGADTFYKYAFGTHSFHVIEKSSCPVIIVPEGITYKPIRLMMYAYDPETNPNFSIENLRKIAVPLGTEVHVLHVTEEKSSEATARKMKILSDILKARAPMDISLSFDFQYSDDIPWTLDVYMKKNKGDMLALSFHHRSLIKKLFTENVIKQISMVADYPVFVF